MSGGAKIQKVEKCDFKTFTEITCIKTDISLQLSLQLGQLTLAAAPIGCQGVAIDWTGTVEAARGVVTAIGANMTSSGQGTLIDI